MKNEMISVPIRLSMAIIIATLSIIVTAGRTAADEWKAPSADSAQKNPVKADETSLVAGGKIYIAKCSDCHGKSGVGDGPDASDLSVKPTNLTSSAVKSQSDGALFWKISTGHRPMPAYGKRLAADQIWNVVNYLHTLNGK